jgi:predicted GH43/DUF377 family glycosyl hydrolase
MEATQADLKSQFTRLGVVLEPKGVLGGCKGVLNPACSRLREGSLQLYPRVVSPDNVSRIGSFRARERPDGTLKLEECGYALQPEALYELRDRVGGYGCEDPRVTFIAALDRYVMAYVAYGSRGPEVAVAISDDGLRWERLGLMRFRSSGAPFADKDASFFPEPVVSPKGALSLAFYHRPSRQWPSPYRRYGAPVKRTPHEGISIGYCDFESARKDASKLCEVHETHAVKLPPAAWGSIKVGGGTPPVRIKQGWLAVIHGVDPLQNAGDAFAVRYSAGLIIHDPRRLDRILYRSPTPLFVPESPGEMHGTVDHVVFPTGIDPRPDLTDGTFDIYYGMADIAIGRGRLRLT